MTEAPTWQKGYRRGSTVFKEVLKKNGKFDYWECLACGTIFDTDYNNRTIDMHEIVHLLQRIRASHSREIHELVFEGVED